MRNLQKLLAVITLSISLSSASLVVQASSNTIGNSAEEEILMQINNARTDAGLNTLTFDVELQRAADVRAKEAADKFSHERPDGSSFYTVSEKAMAENLAKGDYNNEDEIVSMWMASPSHKGNILYPGSTKTGIAIYEAPNGSIFIAQMFN